MCKNPSNQNKSSLDKSEFWSSQEEQLLKNMIEEKKQHNWSEIAKTFAEITNKHLVTGKKCREKCVNFLKFEKDERKALLSWSVAQEEILYTQYEILGSKWVQIAKHFELKSENTLKNKFYGSIRKLTRKLNQEWKKSKEIKKRLRFQSVLKPIEYEPKSGSAVFCGSMPLAELRIKIIDAAHKGIDEYPYEEILELIHSINRFNLNTRNSNTKKNTLKKPRKVQRIKTQTRQASSYNSEKSPQANNSTDLIKIGPQMSNNLLEETVESRAIYKQTDFCLKLIDFTFYEFEKQIQESQGLWKRQDNFFNPYFFC